MIFMDKRGFIMKNYNKYRIISTVILVLLVASLVYSLVFLKEKHDVNDIKYIVKKVCLIVAYAAAVLGIRVKHRPNVAEFKLYEDLYADIISESFKSDKALRRKLLTAIGHYQNDYFEKAVKLLDKLKPRCETPQDISAVLMFKALCCKEMGLLNMTIDCYEELLRTDAANSRAWSNLGNAYLEKGDTKSALDSCENAIRYDPSNAYAYNNMAGIYLRLNDLDNALKFAKISLELKGDLYTAAGIIAISYARLGDRENAEKYYKLHNSIGGSGSANGIRQLMDEAYSK